MFLGRYHGGVEVFGQTVKKVDGVGALEFGWLEVGQEPLSSQHVVRVAGVGESSFGGIVKVVDRVAETRVVALRAIEGTLEVVHDEVRH